MHRLAAQHHGVTMTWQQPGAWGGGWGLTFQGPCTADTSCQLAYTLRQYDRCCLVPATWLAFHSGMLYTTDRFRKCEP